MQQLRRRRTIKNSTAKCTNKAFVSGYAPCQFTIEELFKVLKSKYPFIRNINMPYKSKTWQGYAFVEFKDKDDFLKLKRIRLLEFEMNLVIKPQKLGRALKNFIKDFKKRRVLVKNIPVSWDDFKLEEFFKRYGKLENAYVIRSHDSEAEFTEGMVAFLAKKDAVRCYEQEKIAIENGHWIEVEHFQGKDTHHHQPINSQTHQKKNEVGHNLKVSSGHHSAPKSPERQDYSETIHCSVPTEKRYHYLLQKMEHPHRGCRHNLRLNRPKKRVCGYEFYY